MQVSAASGAYPIVGALVTISDNDSGIIRVLETDRSGKTPEISLPTPSISESMTPGKTAYSVYNIDTDAEGYYGARNIGVAVFPNTTSIQSVSLVPVSPDYTPRNGKTLFFNENMPQNK